jgi:cation diffusion facilitator family transporter
VNSLLEEVIVSEMTETIPGATRRSVFASLAANGVETVALGFVAFATGSVALRAQTAANAAEVAVGVFLLIGVLSSARPANQTHPVGYGRERFFWSLFAALGIFVGGGGLALEGAVRAGLHPSPVNDLPLAYLVLATSIALDAIALEVALRPLRRRADDRGLSLRSYVQGTTDTASMTVVVGGSCAVLGGVVATVGLVVSQATGSALPDTIASALIGLSLLVASVVLLQTNRALLVGRGVPAPMLREMRRVIAAQPGVIDIPDLFAVVIGPSSLIIDGDIVVGDDVDVPILEQTINHSATALRERWPGIEYVYLTPVPEARLQHAIRSDS